MPRFNPERWKPEHDSSPGVFQLDPERVVLYRYGDGCPCGCAGFPEGAKATFRMGHDARLRGILIRAHLMDIDIRYILAPEQVSLEPVPAYDLAGEYGWQHYLDSAVLKREGKNRELLKRALASPNLLKAGKWAYTGGQVVVLYKPDLKNMMDIQYVNRAGEIRKSRIPASRAEEIA